MTLPRARIDLQVNTQDFERDMRRVINAANDADSALDALVVSANRVESALSSIGSQNIDITVNESEIHHIFLNHFLGA